MKKKFKTLLLGAAACLTAAAVALPLGLLSIQAAERFADWKDAGKKDDRNGAEISIQLMEEEKFDECATFQLAFRLEKTDGSVPDEGDCDFQFSQGIKGNPKVVVYDYQYLEGGQIRLVVSGRKEADGTGGVLSKKAPCLVGKLYVASDQDVTVSVVEEECKAVDERGELVEISQFGEDNAPYVIKASQEIPDDTAPDPGNPDDPNNPSGENPDDPNNPSGENPDDPSNPSGGNPVQPDDGNGQPGTEDKPSGGIKPGGSSGGSGGSGGGNGRSRSSGRDREEFIESNLAPGPLKEADGTWEAGADGTWRFKFSDGTYAKNQWIYVKGRWYRIGADGIMIKGWFETAGLWYYLKPTSGAMATGWYLVDGYWYYMGSNGIMRSNGWRLIDGKWYYLNPTPAVPKEVVDPVTKAVTMSTKGQVPLGGMYANTRTPDGYNVDADGVWIP